jgi:CBS domain-containing protein
LKEKVKMKVKDIMTKELEVIQASASVKESAEIMKKYDIGSLPIVEGSRVVGILTDRDIVLRSDAPGHDPNEVTVNEIMTGKIAVVSADQDVSEAARLMSERQVRRLPVVDRDMLLIGIVSLGDIAEDVKQKEVSAGALEKISKPSKPRK